MAPVFKSERPLTRSQYAQRRDQTTKEELAKLKSTPEFSKFAKTRGISVDNDVNNRQLILSAVIAVVVTILLAAFLPGNVTPTEILGFVQPTTSDRLESLEQQRHVTQTTVDLEYSVIELTSHLKSTEMELYAAQRENKNLMKALELERNQSSANTTTGPAPTATTTTSPVGSSLQWSSIIGAISIFIVAIVGASWHTKHQIATATSALRSENLNLTAQLQELAFEKDMAEQSISILEGELQRKMNQLAEAQYKKPATPVQATGNPENEAVGSPRIRAVQNQKAAASPTPLSLANTSPLLRNGMLQPQRTPDSLPPPPRQLVERFLEERGAIAIEQEQVQAWLEMEGLFGKLQREVATLRAVVEGREGESVEQQRRIDELNQALEEQKKAARMAKDALKAVRSVGTDN